MQFSKATKTPLEDALARYLPALKTAGGSATPTEGLSGSSFRIETIAGNFNGRKISHESIPGLSLHRYQRALKRIAPNIGPKPYRLAEGWLFTRWIAGNKLSGELPATQLAELLQRLHHHRLFGWRISLAPLLRYYWQNSLPGRRSPYWLAQLKTLLKQGEPLPIRLAALHMDVHSGNVIVTPQGLRLIDWEYAGDGDVALELATILRGGEIDGQRFVSHYAQRCQIDLATLQQQIVRWQPWIALLSASWYECRFKQTNNALFAEAADNAWQEMERKQENIWGR